MAEGKKSFVLYCDLMKNIDHLTTKEKGVLFNHILEYVNDLNPVLEDRVLLSVWKPIQTQLKRDLKKYEQRADRSRKNGKLGGRPKKPKKPSGFLNNLKNLTEPKKPDNVNDNVNVNDNDILKPFNDFIKEVKNGNHESTIQLWYMQLGLKEGSLTKLLTVGFKSQLLTDNKIHKNTAELKRHFKNWLNTQDRVGKLQEYKKQKSI